MILAEAGIIYRKQRSPQRISSRSIRRFITLILDQICYHDHNTQNWSLSNYFWLILDSPQDEWGKFLLDANKNNHSPHLNATFQYNLFLWAAHKNIWCAFFVYLYFTLSYTIKFCIAWGTFLWSAHTPPCEPGDDPHGATCPTSSQLSSGPFLSGRESLLIQGVWKTQNTQLTLGRSELE